MQKLRLPALSFALQNRSSSIVQARARARAAQESDLNSLSLLDTVKPTLIISRIRK